jgi:hypothetical protein
MNPFPAGSLCITAADPIFIAAIGSGITGAAFLSAVLVRVERGFRPAGLPATVRNLLWFAAACALVVGPLFVLQWLFAWRYPGETLCTSFVGTWFLAPPVLLLTGGALWTTLDRKRRPTD